LLIVLFLLPNKTNKNLMAVVAVGQQLERLKETKLVNAFAPENTIIANSLWHNQPVFVQVVRRPGCKLCRVFSALTTNYFRNKLKN
jgi:hypothetical protein